MKIDEAEAMHPCLTHVYFLFLFIYLFGLRNIRTDIILLSSYSKFKNTFCQVKVAQLGNVVEVLAAYPERVVLSV